MNILLVLCSLISSRGQSSILGVVFPWLHDFLGDDQSFVLCLGTKLKKEASAIKARPDQVRKYALLLFVKTRYKAMSAMEHRSRIVECRRENKNESKTMHRKQRVAQRSSTPENVRLASALSGFVQRSRPADRRKALSLARTP